MFTGIRINAIVNNVIQTNEEIVIVSDFIHAVIIVYIRQFELQDKTQMKITLVP